MCCARIIRGEGIGEFVEERARGEDKIGLDIAE
jgi:hypothetical protein